MTAICWRCDGEGRVTAPNPFDPLDPHGAFERCTICHGSGELPDRQEPTLTDNKRTPQQKVAHAMNKIERAINDFERYGPNTYGRRDSKVALRMGIAELVDAKIEAALADLLIDFNKRNGQ
jgi:hypothetical protein